MCSSDLEKRTFTKVMMENIGCKEKEIDGWVNGVDAVSYTHLDVYKRQT